MKISEAKKLAVRLKNLHGLTDWEVTFAESPFYDADDIIASTYFIGAKLFEFSPRYFSINEKKFCKDQILHEIAHALVGWRANHGLKWKNKCVEIGAIPHELWEGYHSFKSPDRSVKDCKHI